MINSVVKCWTMRYYVLVLILGFFNYLELFITISESFNQLTKKILINYEVFIFPSIAESTTPWETIL